MTLNVIDVNKTITSIIKQKHKKQTIFSVFCYFSITKKIVREEKKEAEYLSPYSGNTYCFCAGRRKCVISFLSFI